MNNAQVIFSIAHGVSMVSFAWYGLLCLFSRRMVGEFERYGLARFRLLTGTLQLAGSLGLLAGYHWRPLLLLSAAGLAALMVAGMITRLKIRDPIAAILPAFAFFCLNLFLVVYAAT